MEQKHKSKCIPVLFVADVIVCLGSNNTRIARLRALKAVELYRQKKAPVILFSGMGRRKRKVSEAAFMASLALSLGVPNKQVIVEEHSRSTLGNAHYSKTILENNQFKSLILVTDEFHMERALYLFRMTMPKMSVVGVACDPPFTGLHAVLRAFKERQYLFFDKWRGVRSKL